MLLKRTITTTLLAGVLALTAAAAPARQPLELPLKLEQGKDFRERFGYEPDYVQNIPCFDSRNRPYIRSRGDNMNQTWSVHTLRNGRWVEHDFLEAVRARYPNFRSISRGGGFLSARIIFDEQDRAYTALRINLEGEPSRVNVLLVSEDYGQTWSVHELGAGDSVALEHFVGHNPILGPPFVLQRAGHVRDHPDDWGSFNELRIIQPRFENGELVIPESIHVSDDLISIGQHSGDASFAVTKDGKTHFVWVAATMDDVPGAPTYVATYDHQSGTVGPKVLLAYAPPDMNSHSRPGIVIDSEGYLHVVTGSHGHNFKYTRSLKPNDAYSGWTEPVNTLETGHRRTGEAERGAQTYVSLVCDAQDTLHLVFRQWRRNVDDCFDFERAGVSSEQRYGALSYQRKKKDRPWDEQATVLMVPEVHVYAIYHQSLALDRLGRLFLSLVYVDREIREAYGQDAFRNRMVLVSQDGGDTWELARTAHFAEGVHE